MSKPVSSFAQSQKPVALADPNGIKVRFAREAIVRANYFFRRATLEWAPDRELLLQNDLFLKYQ